MQIYYLAAPSPCHLAMSSIVATSALAVSGPTPGIVASSATAGIGRWSEVAKAPERENRIAESREPKAEFSAR